MVELLLWTRGLLKISQGTLFQNVVLSQTQFCLLPYSYVRNFHRDDAHDHV
jgi:hypothetical protein